MIEIEAGPQRRHHPETRLYGRDDKKVSFRMLTFYDARIDGLVTRFDILLNGKPIVEGAPIGGDLKTLQFGTEMASDKSYLLVPSGGKGVFSSEGALFSAKELSEAFRALADVIDKHSG